MNWRQRCFLLLAGIFLCTPTLASAVEEEPAAPKPVVEVVPLSEEDQQIVAMLELLEMMELLNEMETVAAMEANQ